MERTSPTEPHFQCASERQPSCVCGHSTPPSSQPVTVQKLQICHREVKPRWYAPDVPLCPHTFTISTLGDKDTIMLAFLSLLPKSLRRQQHTFGMLSLYCAEEHAPCARQVTVHKRRPHFCNFDTQPLPRERCVPSILMCVLRACALPTLVQHTQALALMRHQTTIAKRRNRHSDLHHCNQLWLAHVVGRGHTLDS